MRLIGHLGAEGPARTFADYLYVQGIDTQLDFEAECGWAVWIRDEDRIKEALEFLAAFKANPSDSKYSDVAKEAGALRAKRERSESAYLKRVRDQRDLFPSTTAGSGPLTLTLLLISVVVFLITAFGRETERVSWLFISSYYGAGLSEVLRGQVWRLITPIFIHMGPLHILFNMLWLYDIGTMLERRMGFRRYALMVLGIAVLSNVGEHLITKHTRFGGMSGVDYGLFGYVWIRSRVDPHSGLFLHQTTVVMMLAWFVLCFTGIFGPVANYAHAVGLVSGMAWAYTGKAR